MRGRVPQKKRKKKKKKKHKEVQGGFTKPHL